VGEAKTVLIRAVFLFFRAAKTVWFRQKNPEKQFLKKPIGTNPE